MPAKRNVEKVDPRDIELMRDPDTRTIRLPHGMQLDDAIKFLVDQKDREEQIVAFDRTFRVPPLAGAHALAMAMKEIFHWQKLVPQRSFWGSTPPRVIDVQIGPNETVGVPWGDMSFPGFGGVLRTVIDTRDGMPVLRVIAQVQRKGELQVREMLNLADRYSIEHSIYRGRAIRMPNMEFDPHEHGPENFQVEFLDTSTTNVDSLILPKKTAAAVQTHLFAPIEHTEECRARGIPLKRAVLLHGPYGTGKSLAASVTAARCARNGWTFIFVRSADQLLDAIRFASRFSPACVFAEDLDEMLAGDSRNSEVNELLNTIDGIESKGIELLMVFTTNHVERLNPAVLRPGRLDALIPMLPPDEGAVLELLRRYTGVDLDEQSDPSGLVAVCRKLAGRIPAAIAEACKHAKLAAIARGERVITPAALEIAADSMTAQMELIRPPVLDSRSDSEKMADGLHGVAQAIASLGGTAQPPVSPTYHVGPNGVRRQVTDPALG